MTTDRSIPLAKRLERTGAQIKKERENPNRKKIYKLIKNRPGIRLCDISRSCGMNKESVKHHTQKLKQKKKIIDKNDGKYKRFYTSHEEWNDHVRFVSKINEKSEDDDEDQISEDDSSYELEEDDE